MVLLFDLYYYCLCQYFVIMTEDEFILRQCDWTKMSIFLILTGKSELILETERHKETQNYKININTSEKDAEKS